MNLKELYNSKQKYFEAERIYGEQIYQFIKDTYNKYNNDELHKSTGAKIEFKEYGEYSSPELVVSMDNTRESVLNDFMITCLEEEYDLKCTYKCINTGVNMLTESITQKARAYFKHNWKPDEYRENQKHRVDTVNGIHIEYNKHNVSEEIKEGMEE